jgi:hypothetical protein
MGENILMKNIFFKEDKISSPAAKKDDNENTEK